MNLIACEEYFDKNILIPYIYLIIYLCENFDQSEIELNRVFTFINL